MKNILCTIDFSDVTEKVIKEAAEMAKVFPAKLWLLHVAAPEPDFVGYSAGPQNERDWRALKLHEEHKYIQQQARKLKNDGLNVYPLLIEGKTVEIILKKIDELKIDMVVAGTHGHKSLHSILLGSVSRGIVKKAKCPILLVPTEHSKTNLSLKI